VRLTLLSRLRTTRRRRAGLTPATGLLASGVKSTTDDGELRERFAVDDGGVESPPIISMKYEALW